MQSQTNSRLITVKHTCTYHIKQYSFIKSNLTNKSDKNTFTHILCAAKYSKSHPGVKVDYLTTKRRLQKPEFLRNHRITGYVGSPRH